MTSEADRRLTGAYLQGLPAQAARALEAMDPEDVARCLEIFDPASVAPAVAAMRAGAGLTALRRMTQERARAVLAAMDPISAVAILRLADADTHKTLTEGMSGRQVRRLRRAAAYPADVAGAWCNPLVPVWQTAAPAGEVAEAVRKIRKGPDDPLMLVHEDGRFAGCAPIADVLSAAADRPVRRLMRRNLHPVLDTMTLAETELHEGWLDYAVLPVIDVRGRLVGALSRRRMRDALDAAAVAPAPAADAEDVVTAATGGATSWLAVILEAILSPRGAAPPAASSDPRTGAGR